MLDALGNVDRTFRWRGAPQSLDFQSIQDPDDSLPFLDRDSVIGVTFDPIVLECKGAELMKFVEALTKRVDGLQLVALIRSNEIHGSYKWSTSERRMGLEERQKLDTLQR